MDRNQKSIIADKAAAAAGPVHRPSSVAGPSGSQPRPEFHEHQHSAPVELPAHDTNPGADYHHPPPYSSPSSSSLEPRARTTTGPKGPQRYPGLPLLDYRKYSPPMFDLSADSTTISSKANYLSENSKALSTLIQGLASVPPKPQVSIQGSRNRRIDFSVKLNLMNLIVPENPSERLDYLRCVHRDEAAYRGGATPSLEPDLGAEDGLEGWCQRFVIDQASVKTFTLERVVANLDTNWLEGQIRSLVATTNYKGIVSVQFPVTHAKVVVQTPDKVNKFFTSMSTLFSSKSRYEVVKAVWPFANAKNGEYGRRCLVQSEQIWWEEWRDPIKYAISTKRHGWVTNEDKLECIMESKGKGMSIVDWGPESDQY